MNSCGRTTPMQQITTTSPGAAPRPGRTATAYQDDGRWRLLDALGAAPGEWGLKPRHLVVLRALLSFLPHGAPPEARTVFPSNRALCERLHGMPESTLRRQLAALVGSGLVARRDSANRKRFRVGRAPDLAFGFDLSPLFEAGEALQRKARQAAELAEAIEELRARCRLAASALPEAERSEAHRILRRKLDLEALNRILGELRERAVGARLGDADDRNERHKESDPQIPPEDDAGTIAMFAERHGETRPAAALRTSLLAAGIDDTTWRRAVAAAGPQRAIGALASTLRRLDTVRRPPAYLLACTAPRAARQREVDCRQPPRCGPNSFMPGPA